MADQPQESMSTPKNSRLPLAGFLRAHIAHTMAFYHPRCIDPDGGFFHYFRDDGSVYDATIATSSAARASSSTTRWRPRIRREMTSDQYLAATHHGLRYLRDVHSQPATGGYAWTLRDGDGGGRTNHCYGVAFVLLAYATRSRPASRRRAAGWTKPGSCWSRAIWEPRPVCTATRPTRLELQRLPRPERQHAHVRGDAGRLRGQREHRYLDRALRWPTT
jgi:mannose/cellobiose epimerase-like protein (N-acyl-D-glucosamine 2-epimerase family)